VAVKRVLLTGMSGTGKSTLVGALAARGYRAVDADYGGWSEYRDVTARTGEASQPEWVWREDRIEELLSTEDSPVLFLSGCASNQGRFYPQFDHVVLLSAPAAVIRERLATRTNNRFGKSSEELAQVLEDQRSVEPLLRRNATLELDTSAPLEDVLAAILRLVEPTA
jgi:dephospho-CoA kinase